MMPEIWMPEMMSEMDAGNMDDAGNLDEELFC